MESPKEDNTYNVLFNFHSFKLRLVAEGIIVGICTGFIISLFRFFVDKSSAYLSAIYHIISLKPVLIPAWVAFMLILGYLMGLLIKKEPMISGGGIPQVEGVILRKFDMKWLRVITGKFVGSLVSIGSGLSLGIEGPSVQIGAAVGQGVGSIFKRLKIEQKYLITSGVSAGISAAFGAPLAGTMFALEEVHKNFSPLILVSALSSALSADFVSREIFGMAPVFNFRNVSILPLNYYAYIIILGIVVGIAGVGFNKALLKAQKVYSKSFQKVELRPLIPFAVSIIVAFAIPQALGSGSALIMSLTNSNWTLRVLIILLIVKFIFTIVSAGSGTPGGIFLPIFAIGALIGSLYGNTLSYFLGIKSGYIGSFVILAMAGYFGATIKSPITGSILVIEMTGSFNNLLPVTIMSVIAYIVSDVLNSRPIFEVLLEKFLSSSANESMANRNKRKSILEVPVCMGALIDQKKVKDVKWPKHCLIVGIKRGNNEIIPKGETVIYPGDYLTVLTDEDAALETDSLLRNITKTKLQ